MERMIPFSLDLLRRRPDVEAPELVAVDAADRLLLATARRRLAGDDPGGRGGIVTINDSFGALTLGAAQLSGRSDIRVFQDSVVGERALALNAAAQGLDGVYRVFPLGASLLTGADTVLVRLPRSLDELDEIARTIAAHAAPGVRVFLAGRVKHMTLSMNAVLDTSFGEVGAGLARQKARVLTAGDPRGNVAPSLPRSAGYDVGLDRPLELRAFGATFGGAALDPGTRLLLPHLRNLTGPAVPSDPSGAVAPDVIDLGCGNGTVAAYLALTDPGRRVHATDQSASAVASTLATAEANGVRDRITVSRDDALSGRPDGSSGLIVLNPPFHLGSTVHTGAAHRLFRACARVLVPGGELWTVWNSHLRYRSALERTIGPTRQVERSSRYTITCSTRR